jgi:hypothetical protein
MLIKLNGVRFNPDLIVLTCPGPDDSQIIYLSKEEGGRKITLPEESARKLDLFLAAHTEVDLDGPAFQKSAFEKTASLKAELQAREAIRGTLAASEALKAADGHLNALAGQSKRLPPEQPAAQNPGLFIVPPPTPVVPPAPPLSGDDFEPDPSLFVAKNPRKGAGFLDNLG